jgi:hypothetical protein
LFQVELDEPKGKNDGSCDGVFHFRSSTSLPASPLYAAAPTYTVDYCCRVTKAVVTQACCRCKPNHGVYTRSSRVEPFDELTSAATVIQASFRKRRDGKRAQDQRAFTDRNEVEMDQEVAFLKQNETLCAVDDLLDRSHSEKRKINPAWVSKVESIHIEAGYKGPHFPLQPTRYDAEQLVAYYRANPEPLLHKKYALQLCMGARDYLLKEHPTALHEMPIEEGRRMYVLGDTHGAISTI